MGTWTALALAAVGALVVARSGQGTRGGATAGLAVAVVSIAGLGAGTMLPLAVFVLGSGALTRLGRGRKEAQGAAQANRGIRDARHVAAKLGLPAILALAAIAGVSVEVLSAAYAAAIAGAFADTAATETGPVVGGPVFGWREGRVVRLRHGEPGGVSLGGVAASAAASGSVALAASAMGLLGGAREVGWVAGAGVVASMAESAIAGTFLGRALGHFGRNAFVSVVGAALGALVALAGPAN